MIDITVIDNIKLNLYLNTIVDVSVLMRDWQNAREEIFDNQFSGELNPENQPLRSLSAQYQDWKNRNYPGRKKRELTGQTYDSHNFLLGRNSVTEEIGVHAVQLQEQLDLPLLPEDWTNPTFQTLYDLSESYLIDNF